MSQTKGSIVRGERGEVAVPGEPTISAASRRNQMQLVNGARARQLLVKDTPLRSSFHLHFGGEVVSNTRSPGSTDDVTAKPVDQTTIMLSIYGILRV